MSTVGLYNIDQVLENDGRREVKFNLEADLSVHKEEDKALPKSFNANILKECLLNMHCHPVVTINTLGEIIINSSICRSCEIAHTRTCDIFNKAHPNNEP